MDGSELARQVIKACQDRGWMVATAESCTGGMVAACLTDIPGSSAVVDGGFVTYSNQAKAGMLGVDMALIEAHGAVSAEVAQAMAEGALQHSRADVSVAITGIAGPGGGTATKPVGLVHFACKVRDDAVQLSRQEFGAIGRADVRARSVQHALAMIVQATERV